MSASTTHGARRPDAEHVSSIVCAAVADFGLGMGWRVRMRAAELLLTHLAGTQVRVQVVRAVAYGHSAFHRHGLPLIPRSEAELQRFYDRAGAAALVLGYDQPHAVLIIDDRVLVESFSWNDHSDPGVLLQPFVRDLGPDPEARFTVTDVACGGAAAYERIPYGVLAPLNRQYEQMALQLARACAPRVRWQLDASPARRERPA